MLQVPVEFQCKAVNVQQTISIQMLSTSEGPPHNCQQDYQRPKVNSYLHISTAATCADTLCTETKAAGPPAENSSAPKAEQSRAE